MLERFKIDVLDLSFTFANIKVKQGMFAGLRRPGALFSWEERGQIRAVCGIIRWSGIVEVGCKTKASKELLAVVLCGHEVYLRTERDKFQTSAENSSLFTW